MKVVKMIRSAPEIPGTPTTTEVQEQDIPALEARGWEVDGESYEVISTDEKKNSLIAKAIDLELGTENDLNAMSIDDLTKLIADNIDTSESSEKEALIAKALEMKAAHPKEFKASPSAIPAMSVEKLTKLIAEAEAAITAGNQE